MRENRAIITEVVNLQQKLCEIKTTFDFMSNLQDFTEKFCQITLLSVLENSISQILCETEFNTNFIFCFPKFSVKSKLPPKYKRRAILESSSVWNHPLDS